MSSKILEKLEKLLKKAESTDNQAEAEAFMAKVNELLVAYNLEMADLRANMKVNDTQPGLPTTEFELGDYLIKTEGSWVSTLLFVICKYNFCKGLLLINSYELKRTKMWIVGEEVNIKTVLGLFDYLFISGKKLCSKAWTEYHGPDKKGTFKRSFYMGYNNILTSRLQEIRQEQEKNKPQVMALVRSTDALIKTAMEEEFGNNLGRAKASKSSSTAGYGAGVSAGRNISLNKQMQ